MKIFATVSALTAITALSFTALSAEAGKGHRGKGGKLIKQLVRAGALTKEELKALRPGMKEARACRKAVKAGAQAKGSCLPKFIETAKAHQALLQGALPKVTDDKLKAKLERHLAKMTKRIAKMEAKAAAPAPAPAQ